MVLRYFDEHKKNNQKTITYYEKNDVNALLNIIFNENESTKYFLEEDRAFWRHWFYQERLVNRTRAWLPNLETYLLSNSTFVAVGAAHLFGEAGLINLLEKRGYTVSPVMPHN